MGSVESKKNLEITNQSSLPPSQVSLTYSQNTTMQKSRLLERQKTAGEQEHGKRKLSEFSTQQRTAA
jgi:hypothetical protein